MMKRLDYEFFHRPCVEVAQDLVGKLIVSKTENGIMTMRISETEAYCGEEDTACHAHKGRTKRTEVMYHDVYLFMLWHALAYEHRNR